MSSIPEPYPWRVSGIVDGLNFKLFHEQVGHNGVYEGTHGCLIYLFKILTLEAEICVSFHIIG